MFYVFKSNSVTFFRKHLSYSVLYTTYSVHKDNPNGEWSVSSTVKPFGILCHDDW